MCCCSFQESLKRSCKKFILFESVLLFLLGANVAGVGYYVLRGGQDPISSKYSNFTPDFTGEKLALYSGLACVIVALFGCLTA